MEELDSIKMIVLLTAHRAPLTKSDLIRNDTKAIKLCILYEFLQGTPTLKAFGNFCEAIGNDVIEYREFDYWYHQIGVECEDLNEDICWNPKSKTLTDMPLNIVDTVLDNVKPIDRLVLRKVSQNLRSITKAREHGYKEVSLTVRPTFASIQIDRPRWPDCDKIKYISQDDGSCNVVLGGKSSKIEGISYVKAAVNDLAQLMDNPKSQFEVMRLAVSLNGHPLEFEEIHDDDPLLEIKNRLRREISVKIADALNGVKIQFQVETLIIRETIMPAIVSMVSRFKPGKVERIHISRYKIEENREPVDELVNLESWKKAIDIETNTVSEIHLQIDHVMHSKRFEIAKETFSEKEAIQIRDILTKSTLFEEGLIKLPDYDYEAIGKVFDPAYVHTGPNAILYSSNDVQFVIKTTDFTQNTREMAEKLTIELDSKKSSDAPSLFDMPNRVLHEIMDNVDPINRLVLRKVCRKLRNFLDNRDPCFKHVELSIYNNSYWIHLHSECWCSTRNTGLGGYCTNNFKNPVLMRISRNSLNEILRVLEDFLAIPKLEIDHFRIKAAMFQEKIENRFPNSKICARRLEIGDFCPSQLTPIISRFEPGFLKEISIEWYGNRADFREIYDLEQWKQAKSIIIKPESYSTSHSYLNIPIEQLFHLSHFDISDVTISVDDAMKIRNILLKSASLEYAWIYSREPILLEVVKVFDESFIGDFTTSEYKINQYRVTVDEKSLIIDKTY